jgi:hypothetical protein
MSTFFDTLKRSFTDVPVDAGKDNAISTTEFLEAAESLVTLFGMSPLQIPSLVPGLQLDLPTLKGGNSLKVANR